MVKIYYISQCLDVRDVQGNKQLAAHDGDFEGATLPEMAIGNIIGVYSTEYFTMVQFT